MTIGRDDLTGAATRDLVAFHLGQMRQWSPPESVHALEVDALLRPGIEVFTAWDGDRIAGIGALARLDAGRGELKSMRVADDFRGRGVGRLVLEHLVHRAVEIGLQSLWLETGSQPEFEPARRLYRAAGFTTCPAFPPYRADPASTFMTRSVAD